MLSVDCPCGNKIPVQTSQAGSTVSCLCGQVVRVPRLSELQRRAGMPPTRANTLDVIEAMRLARELPTSTACAYSRTKTSDVAHVVLSCNVPCVDSVHAPWWATSLSVLLGFVVPMRASWITAATSPVTMVKQAIVRIPLRLDHRHLADVRALDNAKLHELLRSEPIYSRLLDEYPYLEASVES
jgi:hypothetical protein